MNPNDTVSSPPGNQSMRKTFSNPFSGLVTAKIITIVFLILLLMIPLGMIDGKLYERMSRRNEAVTDITSSWGNEQLIIGPVLMIPYQYDVTKFRDTLVEGKLNKIEVIEKEIGHAWFLPDDLNIEGSASPEKLYRGIYEAVVYRGTADLSGTFSKPDFQALKISEEDVLWEDASISIGVSDLRGTEDVINIEFAGEKLHMSPGTDMPGFTSGIKSRLLGFTDKLRNESSKLPFNLSIGLKGSTGINFAPLGIQNTVKMSSTWPDPSFKGLFLPTERTINKDGFNAFWKISYYGRSYPQAFDRHFQAKLIESSLFGVSFYHSLDSYRMVERAIKYGILFLFLVFAVFFLYETLFKLRIHFVQYALTGAAMSLFYLCLLSLSEFISFTASYTIAAVACTLLISLYSGTVLKGGRGSLIIGSELIGIYIFLFVTLNLQDYSLLLGTIGLFFILSVIMYVTRNLDWHSLDSK